MISIFSHCIQDMTSLLYLYLTDNHIDYIPVPLPASLRSLHLQVYLLCHMSHHSPPVVNIEIEIFNAKGTFFAFLGLNLFIVLTQYKNLYLKRQYETINDYIDKTQVF